MQSITVINIASDELVNQAAHKMISCLSRLMSEDQALLFIGELMNVSNFQRFIVLWLNSASRNGRFNPVFQNLFGGYFCQEAAHRCTQVTASQELLHMAVDHYTKFLEDPEMDSEIRYFAQWQLGLAYELLGFPWPDVEATLLSASKYHNDRGETMQHVIQHYRATGGWSIGYIYSSITKDKFHDRLPADCELFINPALYYWKIMYYHATICSEIDLVLEKVDAYRKVYQYALQHPNEFSEKQMSYFEQYKN